MNLQETANLLLKNRKRQVNPTYARAEGSAMVRAEEDRGHEKDEARDLAQA
mgnify:FL=1